MEARKGSVMERLSHVHDPRRREGKQYNLPGMVGMLLLAAVNGEESLRGMWLWGCGAWAQIAEPFDLWGMPGPPAYGTVWGLLAGLDAEELSQALCGRAASRAGSRRYGRWQGIAWKSPGGGGRTPSGNRGWA